MDPSQDRAMDKFYRNQVGRRVTNALRAVGSSAFTGDSLEAQYPDDYAKQTEVLNTILEAMGGPQAKRTHFSIDDWGHDPVPGYTLGDTWNGWASPYFTKEQGLKVLEYLECEDSHFQEDSQVFVIKMDEDEYIEVEAEWIPGVTQAVYPIGAGYWVWDEEDDPELRDKIRSVVEANDAYIDDVEAVIDLIEENKEEFLEILR